MWFGTKKGSEAGSWKGKGGASGFPPTAAGKAKANSNAPPTKGGAAENGADKGKGKSRGVQPPSNPITDLEAELTEGATQIYEAVLDLNVPESHLTNLWNYYGDIRQSLLVMYGVAEAPAEEAPAKGGSAAAAASGKAGKGGAGSSSNNKAKGGAAAMAMATMKPSGSSAGKGGMGGKGGGMAMGKAPPAAAESMWSADSWGDMSWMGYGGGWGKGYWGPSGDDWWGEGGSAAAVPEDAYRAKLNQQIAKRAGRPLTKGEITFDTVEADRGYVSTISATSTDILLDSYTGEWRSTRKTAEHAASKAALLAEFPQAHAEVASGIIEPKGGAGPARNGKRKANEMMLAQHGWVPGMTVGPDLKQTLARYASLILGKSATKDDLSYTSEEDQGGRWISTVNFTSYMGKTWTGHACQNKKEAEQAAAEIAVGELEEIVQPIEEERKAKLREKNREKLQKIKDFGKGSGKDRSQHHDANSTPLGGGEDGEYEDWGGDNGN